MPTVKLARQSSITIDGVTILGTRDFDVDIDLDTVDVTPWNGVCRGELPLMEANTVTLQIYDSSDLARLASAWNQFPPQPVALGIDGRSAKFLVHKIKIGGQFSGVQAYDVVLKLWPYS